MLENLISASFNYRPDVSFKSHWESFIPRVFQGLVQKQFACQACSYVREIQEPFLDLSLDIRVATQRQSCRVKPTKMSSDFVYEGPQPIQSEQINLMKCMKDFFKAESFDAQNQYTCPNCGTQS